jgi:hypothetical protein
MPIAMLAAINNKVTVIVAQKKNKATIQFKNFLTGDGSFLFHP